MFSLTVFLWTIVAITTLEALSKAAQAGGWRPKRTLVSLVGDLLINLVLAFWAIKLLMA